MDERVCNSRPAGGKCGRIGISPRKRHITMPIAMWNFSTKAVMKSGPLPHISAHAPTIPLSPAIVLRPWLEPEEYTLR